jgi:hypothetical protein
MSDFGVCLKSTFRRWNRKHDHQRIKRAFGAVFAVLLEEIPTKTVR